MVKINLLTVQKGAPMNYNTLRIVAVSICLYTGHVYSMNDDGVPPISTNTKLSLKNVTPYDKNITSKEQLRTRRSYNLLYGVVTLTMMGIDIANYYFPEKGLFEQKFDHNGQLCECPGGIAHCDITAHFDNHANLDASYSCSQTEGSRILYGINDVMTLWRLSAGCKNLYDIYQIHQALNKQAPTKYTTNMSPLWPTLQSCGSGITGTIASVAGILNGIQNYPKTIAIWGANAIVDALGAHNSYENMKVFQEAGSSPR